jgi:DNA-binding winged helix-turn-helix (wHTH) protein
MAGLNEYWIGDKYRVDASRLEIWDGPRRIKLGPIAFRILIYLVQHCDRFVPSDELIKNAVGRAISPEALRFHVTEIYKALGDTERHKTFIRNDRLRYKLIADVRELPASRSDNLPRSLGDNVSILPMPNSVGGDFRFEDFRRYDREHARLTTLENTAHIPLNLGAELVRPNRIPVGTKWITQMVD